MDWPNNTPQARFAVLVRTFVALTADIYRETPDGELKGRAYEAHLAAASVAKELRITGGAVDLDLINAAVVRDAKRIRELEREIKRLEGGEAPARLLEAQRMRKAAEEQVEAAKERYRRLEEMLTEVASLVDEFAPRDYY